jgi:hypothetical protein
MQDDDGYMRAGEWYRLQDTLGELHGHYAPNTRHNYEPEELVRLFTRLPPERRTAELQRLQAFTKQDIPQSDIRNQARLHTLQRRMMRRHSILLKNGR